MKVKICGLTRKEDMILANRYVPDYIGFVFYPQSKRAVSLEQAYTLKSLLHRQISAVGVFVNEDVEKIREICRLGIVDMIQLHGDEDELYIHRLKALINKPIIKAVRVRSREQILDAEKLPCEYLLLDTYTSNTMGGSGTVFDHSLIPILHKPYFLAGGIDVFNMREAVKECAPFAVDISSGCEVMGYKDAEKMEQLITLGKTL